MRSSTPDVQAPPIPHSDEPRRTPPEAGKAPYRIPTQLPAELRLKWTDLPRWPTLDLQEPEEAGEQKDSYLTPDLVRLTITPKRRMEQFSRRAKLAAFCMAVSEFCGGKRELPSSSDRDRRVLNKLHATHTHRLGEYLGYHYDQLSRIYTNDQPSSSSDTPLHADDIALSVPMSLAVMVFTSFLEITHTIKDLERSHPPLAKRESFASMLAESGQVNTTLKNWLLSPYNSSAAATVHQEVARKQWKSELRKIVHIACQLAFVIELEEAPKRVLLMMEHLTRLWAFVSIQLAVIDHFQKAKRYHVFVVPQTTRRKFQAFWAREARIVHYTVGPIYCNFVFSHALTLGAREAYAQSRVCLVGKVDDPLCRNFPEEDDEKLIGSSRNIAAQSCSPEEMKSILKETTQQSVSLMAADQKHPWRPVLILQLFAESVRRQQQKDVASSFLDTYYIPPLLFWKRLFWILPCEDPLAPKRPHQEPVMVYMLNKLFVMINHHLLEVQTMEDALTLFCCSVLQFHQGRLYDGTDLNDIASQCTDEAAHDSLRRVFA